QLLVGSSLTAPITFTRALTLSGGGPTGDGFALISAGPNTFNGTITTSAAAGTRLAATFGTTTLSSLVAGTGQTTQLSGNGNWSIAALSGSGTFQKSGNGTVILTGNNGTFSGV